jgi:hypothetical protein
MKKKLPLNIIKNFQPKENKNIFLVRPEEGEGFLLHFSDVDSESEFYFRIIQFKDSNNTFLIEYSPASANSNAKYSNWFAVGDVNNRFDAWLKLLSDFNETETIFDDPITKGFQEEYFNFFEIVDEDAESKPLKSKQILILDEHLLGIEEKIDDFITEKNKEAVKEIKKDVAELREELTKKPKKWVIKKLSFIWAKMTKQGTKLLKEFLNEGRKEAIKQGIKLFIEQGGNLLN